MFAPMPTTKNPLVRVCFFLKLIIWFYGIVPPYDVEGEYAPFYNRPAKSAANIKFIYIVVAIPRHLISPYL